MGRNWHNTGEICTPFSKQIQWVWLSCPQWSVGWDLSLVSTVSRLRNHSLPECWLFPLDHTHRSMDPWWGLMLTQLKTSWAAMKAASRTALQYTNHVRPLLHHLEFGINFTIYSYIYCTCTSLFLNTWANIHPLWFITYIPPTCLPRFSAPHHYSP